MQKGLTLNPTPESSASANSLPVTNVLHFANDQRSLNSAVFELHASASQYDIDKFIAELEASTLAD